MSDIVHFHVIAKGRCSSYHVDADLAPVLEELLNWAEKLSLGDDCDSLWCKWNSDPFCERPEYEHCIGDDCPQKECREKTSSVLEGNLVNVEKTRRRLLVE